MICMYLYFIFGKKSSAKHCLILYVQKFVKRQHPYTQHKLKHKTHDNSQ